MEQHNLISLICVNIKPSSKQKIEFYLALFKDITPNKI